MTYLRNLVKSVALYFLKVNLRRKKKLKFGVGVNFNMLTEFEGNNYLSDHSSLTSSFIGFASYLGAKTEISNAKIGRYTSIGPNTNCIHGQHPSNTFVSTHPAFFSKRAQVGFTFVKEQLFNEFPYPIASGEPYTIHIGNDVWIGANVSIMDGITIGNGAIVAANALVAKDVPPYTIVGGVPAKIIKKRFSEEQINMLLKFKWWEKSQDWISKNAALFNNIELFNKNFGDDTE